MIIQHLFIAFKQVAPRIFGLYFVVCYLFLYSPSIIAAERPKVLILNSYHQIYFWTDGIMQGIREVFDTAAMPVDFYVENMDTKRFFNGQKGTHLSLLKEVYREKYATIHFDVIISSDNDAINFLVANRKELFPGTPIVFCGVNNFTDAMLAGNHDITGVVESLDREDTLNIALALHPDTKNIALITDRATTGLGNRTQLEQLAGQYAKKAQFLFLDQTGEGLKFDELLAKVVNLPKDTVIFYSDFHIDRDGRIFIDQSQVAEAISKRSGLPIYTTYASVFGPGTIGGKLNNPVFQGKTVGQMAVRILRGEPVAAIPIQRESPNKFMFQYDQLQRFGLLKTKLPDGSIIVGRPVSFYEEHKAKIWGIAILLVLQAIVIYLLAQNIRQRKRSTNKLARWAQIFEHAQWGIAVGDPHTETLISMNSAFATMHGYTVAELIGLPVVSMYAPEALTELPDHIRLANETGHHTFESLHLRKDGSSFPVRMDVTVAKDEEGTILYRVVNVQDITEHKKTQEALVKSEERLRVSTELAKVAVWEYNCMAKSITRSRNYDHLFGIKWQESCDIHVFISAVHPDDRELFNEIILKATAPGGSDQYSFDFRVVHPDQSIHWLTVVGQVVERDAEGHGIIVCGCLIDISSRKEVELAHQESERFNRALFKSSVIGLALCRMDGSLIDVNDAFATILGRTVEETLKLNYWDITPKHYAEQEARQLKSLQTTGRYGPYEKEYIHKDGHLVHVRLQGLLVERGGEAYIWSSVEDINAIKAAEMILRAEFHILEVIARGDALPEVLEQIVLGVESLSHDTIASILLLDPDGIHVHYGAAPNLPDAYNLALEGASIGPNDGSCGTAAYRREPVIVNDIEEDPLWIDYRELARTHGLRACWSIPILSTKGQILGTFAMYYREPRSPKKEDFTLLARATHLAGIAIENNQTEEKLHNLNAELEKLVKERTMELESKMAELERFNNLFVNRELAMVELKNKVKELEKMVEQG